MITIKEDRIFSRRGFICINIDSEYYFLTNFVAKYKNVPFIFVKGNKIERSCGNLDMSASGVSHTVDSIYVAINISKEETYDLITEFISLFCYYHDVKINFEQVNTPNDPKEIIFNNLINTTKQKIIPYNKSPNLDNDQSIDISLIPCIHDNEALSTAMRCFRKAKTLMHIEDITSYLYMYHIVDIFKEAKENNIVNYFNSIIGDYSQFDEHNKLHLNFVIANRFFYKNKKFQWIVVDCIHNLPIDMKSKSPDDKIIFLQYCPDDNIIKYYRQYNRKYSKNHTNNISLNELNLVKNKKHPRITSVSDVSIYSNDDNINKKKDVILRAITLKDLFMYLRNARNAIAHIIREESHNSNEIELDGLSCQKELSSLVNIMYFVTKKILSTELKLISCKCKNTEFIRNF